jgi:hypothetical protein
MSLKKLILDKTVMVVIASRLFSSLAGLLTIYFIVKYLSPSEQGNYYTFINLIGLSVFFEFGIGTLVIQHTSHHMSHIDFSHDMPNGEEKSLVSFYTFANNILRLSTLLALLILVMLSLIGLLFLKNSVELYRPWLLIVLFTSVNFFVNVNLGVIEGSGKILDVAKLRFIAMLISIPSLWLSIAFGGGVYALPLQLFLSSLILSVWLINHYQDFFIKVYSFKNTIRFKSFLKSTLPLQSKLSLSFLSTYMSVQIIVPALFSLGYVEFAGKLGATMQAFNAINGFAITWINSKLVLFGIQIAKGQKKAVILEFKKLFLLSIFLLFIMLVAFWIAIWAMHANSFSYLDRFLNLKYMIWLTATSIASHFYMSINTYLLSYKEDPLFKLNALRLLFTSIGTSTLFILGNGYGLFYLYVFNSIFLSGFASFFVMKNYNKNILS